MSAARFTPPRQPPNPAPEVVDPRWILKAASAVVALGLLCAYITLCLFFRSGQWQFVLHPSRSVALTPASQGLVFTPVRFADDPSGQPELTGWWMPSQEAADPTALIVHGESGSMSDALPLALALHNARLNVFLFDYRGYGESAGRHPTQSLMEDDTARALHYLTASRGVPVSRIVPVGVGLGASLATHLAAETAQLPVLILVEADGDTLSRVQADQRFRILPVQLLFHDRFPLADALHTLHTPKLLVSYTRGNAPLIAQRAADPKMTAELPPSAPPASLTAVIHRFLSTYIAEPPAVLQ